MVERGFVKLENSLSVDGSVTAEEAASTDAACARPRLLIPAPQTRLPSRCCLGTMEWFTFGFSSWACSSVLSRMEYGEGTQAHVCTQMFRSRKRERLLMGGGKKKSRTTKFQKT